MRTLHAVWQESGHTQEAGLLHLWLENPDAGAVRRGGGKAEFPPHPFAAASTDIQAALEQLLGYGLDESLPTGVLPLHLPTRDGMPMPSHRLDVLAHTVVGWRVPSVWMTAGQAARQLSGVLQRPAAGSSEAHPAPDFLVWASASRWVLALLARERLVPIIQHASPDAKSATLKWVPVLDDAQDAHRMKVLIDAMPPSARATEFEVRSSTETLKSFVSHAIDGLARRWLTEIFGRLPKPYHGWPQGSVQWLAALFEGKTQVAGVANELSRLAKDLQAWSEGLMTPMGRGFRTCFRLHAPNGYNEDWKVQIVLQGADDPTLLMEASELWRPLKGQRQLFEASQEQLLADLGRALKVFPELERCLRQALPSAVIMSTEEAAEFLQRTAWLLEESGFGVQIPTWANRTGTPWSMRLSVSEPATGNGHVGLNNLLNYRWEVAVGDETLDAEEFLAMADSKVPLVMVRGKWVLIDRNRIDQAIKLLEGGKNTPMTLGEALRTAATVDPGLSAQVHFVGELGTLNGEESLAVLDAPERFHGTLRPYQLRGFSWLSFLRQRGLGACLADDMGLGKTIQLIAMLLRDRERGVKDGPALLVCPTSVLGNWSREITRFGPSLNALIHHGAGRRQSEAFADQVRGNDLVITTYALVARDLATLGGVAWSGIILDEAQNIKNPEAQQARAVRRLKAGYRVALTGTPVENRLNDLWSIMEFLNPGLLGSSESFRKRFAFPIERFNNADAVGRLRSLVQPFILRRLKTDKNVISDLPDKQEMKTFCPLTREQASLYQATVKAMLSKVEDSSGIQRRGLILQTMLRLKQICNHPLLFLNDNSEVGRRSGKVARLQEMLEEVLANSDKALIFTQFARMGHILTKHLTEEFACDVLFLHGGVPQKDRDRLVSRFQSPDGPPFLVLSLKAGGVGLNLTEASHVFHFDRWWNPAVEDQATDRAFRIGQTKNVQVHKYICSGTLEEAIDTLIESKVALARQVVGGGEEWLTELSNDQLRQLLSLREEDVEEAV